MSFSFDEIRIDGDSFILTVPTAGMLLDMIQELRDRRISNVDASDCFVYTTVKEAGKQRLFLTTLYGLQERRGLCVSADTLSGWRPMLVPLRHGSGYSSCLERIRNGRVVRGGSLVFEQFGLSAETVQIEDSFGGAVINQVGRKDRFRLTDSHPDPIRNIPWVVWNGRLICARPLFFSCHQMTLVENACIRDLNDLAGSDAGKLLGCGYGG